MGQQEVVWDGGRNKGTHSGVVPICLGGGARAGRLCCAVLCCDVLDVLVECSGCANCLVLVLLAT